MPVNGPGWIPLEVRRSEAEHAIRYKNAALIAYGALLAQNSHGELDRVIEQVRDMLWEPVPQMVAGESLSDFITNAKG